MAKKPTYESKIDDLIHAHLSEAEAEQQNARVLLIAEIITREQQVLRMAKLLLESRDALPCISMARAKLANLDLTLADRIEDELKPWLTTEDDPNGK